MSLALFRKRVAAVLPRLLCCAGRHRWGAWDDTPFFMEPFEPPIMCSTRWCRRCILIEQIVPSQGRWVRFVQPRLNEALRVSLP